jgi:hypothetical protein
MKRKQATKGPCIDISIIEVPAAPDLPRYPDVSVAEEVQALLQYHYGGRISNHSLLDVMSTHATAHVRGRGVAEHVELHPVKRCACHCRNEEGREVCPAMVPKYPPYTIMTAHGLPPVTCACGGCDRGYKHPDACRWLDWSEPVMTVC